MTDNEEQKYNLVNAYQTLVEGTVRGAMGKRDMCQCEKCFMDACAYVYNRGFSHFVTTRQGEVLSSVLDMNQARYVQLLVAAEEAMEMVQNAPRH